ncbi:MAG: class I SAM-dependent methyltransferase [Nanoarchaeota archaeon]|nr:class I SAM-dependent methyltransferase [Nanoarchaeota archaeon]MBU1269614.1 class I SAM-dependent methyltransferase [Nanoarchaeota archaeon]MBU1603822.1 class I SAM-dependent methyltransferase [Nanoarchaeota archaeon]MBU2443254.1 class I SAM-dependent methyltransferase [Nanoarchaeota archaeon]
MNSELEKVLLLTKENPVDFKRFSRDDQQINPELRIKSISNIIKNINLPHKSTIIDIGTGYGYGAVLLNTLGYNVIGIESNEEKLEQGMQYWTRLGIAFSEISCVSNAVNTKGELYFLKRDARNLDDFPGSSVDMATVFYISTYMIGKKSLFNEVGRVLKPEGNLTITTEGHINIPSFLRGPFVKLASKYFKPKGLKCASTFKIDNSEVYDKFVVTYKKEQADV